MAGSKLQEDAAAIWWAGVRAVNGESLTANAVRWQWNGIRVCDEFFPLHAGAKVAVVGAGKAIAAMTRGLEKNLMQDMQRHWKLFGWVNAPSGNVASPKWVHLHSAREHGSNEPTEEGVAGSKAMLEIVENLVEEDLLICLLTGGGSALMPLPVKGVSLADKLAVTRLMSAGGADIWALNTVRKAISAIKGGKLAAHCKAGRILTLILSDVLGDCLHTIASGPTMPETVDADVALRLLRKHCPKSMIPAGVTDYLEREVSLHGHVADNRDQMLEHWPTLSHFVLGNNEGACSVAAKKAAELGYELKATPPTLREGEANQIGIELAKLGYEELVSDKPCALVSGGEPVVKLAPKMLRGKGGRNMQLALAALHYLKDQWPDDLVLLSGGTDGEDGPTPAAGACVTRQVLDRARELRLNVEDFLDRNNAYEFFHKTGGLFETGPTETNVCDVRVVLRGSAAER